MAQTRRKRRTKHRGTAAGTIEARGRTGRPPSADERKQQTRAKAREDRLMRRPTFKGSLQRALVAAVLMFVFFLITFHPKHGGNRLATALVFALLALALYAPFGYYLEMFLWRRRMVKLGKPVTK